ncbi:acyl carrier protein [Streptomyces sp. JH14]|uniref:acyl carrier protein n=1 Tax=Streptomyces sp. JH14 TaxID=2793630 RepID=UPI0023F83D2C|nr:acyl carrier protein [Streptomyces sp. JH14]MDF6043852.1 acyl carrier protein [Streptomyces sp. JH14]
MAEQNMDMELQDIDVELRDRIRGIIADIVEVDIDEIEWTTHFWDELGADSLQGIEILSTLERRLGITIEQRLLAEMKDVRSTYGVVLAARKGMAPDAS